MIELHNITVQIGDATLVEDVSATIRPGRLTAIVGPNGAGKTTLLRVASGELRPSGGTVHLDEQPLTALPPREQARRRAVLPQQSQLHFAFSVLEVVLMGRTPHLQGAETQRDWQIAEAALETVGMADFAGRTFPTLSGGEQQRVHLARALAQIWTPPPRGHRYLLLDEPTASLDLAHQHQVLERAATLATEGVGVLAILHDLNLAAQYADHVIVLRQGRLHAQGPPEAVFTPDCIHDVFGWPVCILDHPTHSCPLIVSELGARVGSPTPPVSSF
ncbi:MAG: heme ABC transporter ATP-binding protein [Bacteroidetes bacterium]|jgi:iron complex transport system ATP-binding protein|nr:heme ABC transporter ATP-binding protein [Bacteroidota bacterium]